MKLTISTDSGEVLIQADLHEVCGRMTIRDYSVQEDARQAAAEAADEAINITIARMERVKVARRQILDAVDDD